MHPHTKSQIITLSGWADIATALIHSFLYTQLEEYSPDPEVVEKLSLKWTIKDSTHWVGVMLDDEFNRQMAWADGTDVAFDSIMLQMSEKYGSALPQILHLDKPNKTQRTLFLEDLIVTLDPVTVVIGEFVSDLVKQNPWWVWSIHGRGDVVLLESDEDFRIKMFNQK